MLILLSYAAVVVFVVGAVYRTWKIRRMPMHLRWELAPVPHEKGKAYYGGSYFEDHEWWTKRREKSLANELWYMFQEIVFLKGIWKHKRDLWYFSFPFHFGGLYLVGASVGLLFLGAISGLNGSFASVLNILIEVLLGTGYLMGGFGVLGLLYRRLNDPDVKPFSTFAHYFNLLFLLGIYASGLYAMFSMQRFVADLTGFAVSLITFNPDFELAAPAVLHVFLACAFLIYLPFTYMMHFIAKYFFYHDIRWNDEPMTAGGKMEKEVTRLLGQKTTWSAPHINGQGKKTWVDVATEEVKK
ncbi:MAG: respiratory nitrate reductase subunit gamma [Deltaproteobacteria bacterium]|nr:respiratory nitrate reductase subunit gamma [Deltaproteobacteria bacterium]